MTKARAASDIYRLHGKNREYLPGDTTGASMGGDLDTGFRHSDAYHSFFEGYTERLALDEKGRQRIQREYTAPWIVEDLSPARSRQVRIAAWLLYLAAVGIYLWCALRPVGSNSSPYVAVSGLLTVIPLLLLFFALVTFTLQGKKLTQYDYKSNRKRLRVLSLMGAVLMAITATMVLLYFLLHTEQGWRDGLLGSVLHAASALCLFALWRVHSRIPYKESANTAQPLEGGSVIK